MFSKKMYYISWEKRFANGETIAQGTYVVARTKRGAIKAAKQQYDAKNFLTIIKSAGNLKRDGDLVGQVATFYTTGGAA